MEGLFKEIAATIALAIEAVAVLVIAFGSAQALVRTLGPLFGARPHAGWRRQVWVHFGMWLMLGLQFELAADIVRSAISPTWESIGQLAAIATIRTALNFFLERDMAELGESASELAG
jgi:uncharacterized membrane protein